MSEIESEVKRQRLLDRLERWAEHTKVKQYLREYDIPGLVDFGKDSRSWLRPGGEHRSRGACKAPQR